MTACPPALPPISTMYRLKAMSKNPVDRCTQNAKRTTFLVFVYLGNHIL